jgi:hypothetical protein
MQASGFEMGQEPVTATHRRERPWYNQAIWYQVKPIALNYQHRNQLGLGHSKVLAGADTLSRSKWKVGRSRSLCSLFSREVLCQKLIGIIPEVGMAMLHTEWHVQYSVH